MCFFSYPTIGEGLDAIHQLIEPLETIQKNMNSRSMSCAYQECIAAIATHLKVQTESPPYLISQMLDPRTLSTFDLTNDYKLPGYQDNSLDAKFAKEEYVLRGRRAILKSWALFKQEHVERMPDFKKGKSRFPPPTELDQMDTYLKSCYHAEADGDDLKVGYVGRYWQKNSMFPELKYMAAVYCAIPALARPWEDYREEGSDLVEWEDETMSKIWAVSALRMQ